MSTQKNTHAPQCAISTKEKKKMNYCASSHLPRVHFLPLNINYIFYVQVYHVLYSHTHWETRKRSTGRLTASSWCNEKRFSLHAHNGRHKFDPTELAHYVVSPTRRQRAAQYARVYDVFGIGCDVLGNGAKSTESRTSTKRRRSSSPVHRRRTQTKTGVTKKKGGVYLIKYVYQMPRRPRGPRQDVEKER